MTELPPLRLDMAEAQAAMMNYLKNNKQPEPITPAEKIGQKGAEIFIEMIGGHLAKSTAEQMMGSSIAVPVGPIPPGLVVP